MADLNSNIAALMQIINGELRQSNIFVSKVLTAAEVNGWSDKQTLAQLVVILGRENNRLQDELLKSEYAKAYSPQISIPVLNTDNVKPLMEAAYYYGERTGDYAMQDIADNENIKQLIAGLNHPMTKGVVMDEDKARKILGGWIDEDGDIFCLGAYLSFEKGEETTSLDGRFTADQLEAIAWWMRNKQ